MYSYKDIIKAKKGKLRSAIRDIERFQIESQRMIDRIKTMSDIEIYATCTNNKTNPALGTLRQKMPMVTEACQIMADALPEPEKQHIYARHS